MLMIKRILFLGFIMIILGAVQSLAQDTAYARSLINKLASHAFEGRGYVKHGDKKAALFVRDELRQSGVEPLIPGYFQSFGFPMNTFPGKMKVDIDQHALKAVDEFVISPDCPAINGTFAIRYLPESADTSNYLYDSLISIDYQNKFVVAPWPSRKITRQNPFKAAGVIVPEKNTYWWASNGHEQAISPIIVICDSILKTHPQQISVHIQNKFVKDYTTQNITAFIRGSAVPDSFIVFTAHYDHLGFMGRNNRFPGANDNASGTAMVLDLARYFGQPEHQPAYSMAFIFFAAEEAGLLGSKYYTEHPVFPLSQIKELINLDMVGSGSEGIAIVDGEGNPAICSAIKSLNEKKGYFSSIQIRGEACNSDHCFFQNLKIPAVFIYTKGPELKEYHNLHDTPMHFPMTKYGELERLLIELCEQEK